MELLKKNLSVFKNFIMSFTLSLSKYKNIGILSVIGFLIGRINIFSSLSPFSLSFLLASGNNPIVLIFTLLGIISTNTLNVPKYVLTVFFGVTLSTLIKWIFPNINKDKVNPTISFISLFTFSLCFTLFKDYVIYDILLVLFESIISFLSYFVLKKGIISILKINAKKYFTLEEITTFLIILTILISGIGDIYIYDIINLKNVISVYIVFLGASLSNIGIGSQIAAFMGIAAGIGSDYMGVFIATYCVNGLIASTMSKYGKVISVLGFTLGNVFMNILMGFEYYMVINYPEILIASFFYILLPDILIKRIFLTNTEYGLNNDSASTIKKIATVKLDRLSFAFRKLSDTICSTLIKNDKLKEDNSSAFYDEVGEKVCKKCALRFYCWQKDYDTTKKAMSQIVKKINLKGTANRDDFPDYFKGKCVKVNEVLQAIISLYEIYRLNSVWQSKMKENAKIYKDQFLELSDIVENLKNEIEKNPYFDKNLSLEISSKLENDGINIKNLSVIKDCNENTQIELTLFPCQKKDKCYKFIEQRLSEILDIPFIKISGKCSFKECVLKFKECESYSLKSSVKQCSKNKNEKSGDNYSIKTLDNSSRYIILCDGSGSGETASFYSKNTIKLLEEFLKTGFSKSASVKLINSSLMCNKENDYFSTIDLSIMDLKNAELEILKKGACPTYIKKANGEFLVIRNNSFPAGIIDEKKEIPQKIKLSENDLIIMISDGIYDSLDKEDWIIEALKAINSNDPDVISDLILKIAQSTENRDRDDMTVIVSKCVSQCI